MTLVVRAGHSHTKGMAFRPDGRVLATCGAQEPGISFWRVRDGELLGAFQGHPGLRRFALSQNRMLTYHPGQLRLWRTTDMDERGFDFPQLASFEADTEQLILTSRFFLFRRPGSVVAMANIQDGSLAHTFCEARWFYTGARGRRVLLGAEKSLVYSGVSGRKVGELEVGCAVAAFSPEDRWLATAGLHDKTVTLVDAESLKTWPIEGHQKRVLQCAFSPDGLWFASAAEDGTLLFLNLEDWQLTLFNTQVGPAHMLVWLCGNRVVVGDGSGYHQTFAVTRGGARTYPRLAPPEGFDPAAGSWCAGPDSLAARAVRGQPIYLVNLSEGLPASRLASALRHEIHISQSLVGQTVLVDGRAWSLLEGKPMGPDNYEVISDKLVSADGPHHRLADGFAFDAPTVGDRLQAICEEGRHFAFYEGKTNHLQVLRRQGQKLVPWRTLADNWRQNGDTDHTLPLGGSPPLFEFSPGGQHLGIFAAQESPKVWLLEANRCQTLPSKPYFLPEGGWVNRNQGELEQWDAGGQRVHTRPLPKDVKALLRSPAGYLVMLNGQGVQLTTIDLQKRLGSINLTDVFRLQISDDGRWLFAIHSDARLTVWSLPSGQRQGEGQQFEANDIKYLKITSGHGWMLASAGGRCGCWHLLSGSFEWLDGSVGNFASAHPLPGGQILLFTQDGSWHLYDAKPPLRRLATLRTTAEGGYLVTSTRDRWDASPELADRVFVEDGPQLRAAGPETRQHGLWGSLITTQ